MFMKKTDARKLHASAQQDMRRKAVKAVLGGRTRVEVAEIFGVTRQSVGKWVQGYDEGGEKALKARKRGRRKGEGKKLLPWQLAQTAKMVTDRHPDQLKLPFYLWTRQAVAGLIEKRFDVQVSVWTVGRYLRAWGFTPQKPVKRAYEQSSEAVRQWLKSQYPEICDQAKREKAQVYWGDEMGLRSDHAVGRTYGRKGQTPVLSVTGRRFGCNMISAITNRGQLNFMVFHDRFTAGVFQDFLSRLIRQYEGRMFLIVDRHPVHRSAQIRDWLEVHKGRIRLFFLPGYSPELNPDELLNQDVKSNALGRRRARDQKELMSNTRCYLRSRQRKPEIVKNYFHGQHVRYAA
jgi:transposase